ncbi:DUF975 family protein [Ligilactobacillus sp.]|uniref:DUF975 family protein n=1 Tax=Ligilactobacillus sp. TaxID=2767921 RepID=UPI002FDF101A
MKTRSELKVESKELLKGHWGKAILLNIVPIAGSIICMSLVGLCVFLIASFVDSDSARHVAEAIGSTDNDVSAGSSGANVGSSVTSIIGTLLTVGVMFTTIDWLRTKKADFNTASGIFAVFCKKYFVGTIILVILTTIFKVLWTLCLIIPGIVKSYSYSQTYYIYKDITDSGHDEDLNFLDYITLSRSLMKGHKLDYFVLQLSFAGWFIVACIIPFGIGFIWYWPYYTTTKAAFYKDLSQDTFLGEKDNYVHLLGR